MEYMKTQTQNSGFLKFFPVFIFLMLAGFLFSCSNDNQEQDNTDKDLYEMAKQTAGFQWYKNSDGLEAGTDSLGSQHGLPYFRARFNTEAATQLDGNGRVKEGATFPEGSLIVKELFDDTQTFAVYAVRLKMAGHKDADAKGWVWGYLNADGSVREPASNKGNACITCHSQAGSIDYVLLNLVVQ